MPHLAHTSEQFIFQANAPMAYVFPLFGAEKERVWAPGWDPQFIWPQLAADREGMVFRVIHGERVATWVNTAFDPSKGRVQYVYVIPDALVTVITLQLRARANATEVVVRYERTSLSPESDAVVREMAEHDRGEGPVWARQVNTYLARTNSMSR